MSFQERLSQFLKESADWERRITSVPGIFLLKLPRSKSRSWREVIAIEINPINQTTLSPTKKRRMVIRSSSELNIKSYGSDKNKMEEDWFELVQKHQA